jgi:hypothetical protein
MYYTPIPTGSRRRNPLIAVNAMKTLPFVRADA